MPKSLVIHGAGMSFMGEFAEFEARQHG